MTSTPPCSSPSQIVHGSGVAPPTVIRPPFFCDRAWAIQVGRRLEKHGRSDECSERWANRDAASPQIMQPKVTPAPQADHRALCVRQDPTGRLTYAFWPLGTLQVEVTRSRTTG